MEGLGLFRILGGKYLMGKGKKFYIVAELVNMGGTIIDIKLTDNENWAKQNIIICGIRAETIEEAREMFRVRDFTRF